MKRRLSCVVMKDVYHWVGVQLLPNPRQAITPALGAVLQHPYSIGCRQADIFGVRQCWTGQPYR